MNGKQISVRLSAAELAELRRLTPGGTDAARVRALIHSHAISSGLAAEIAAAVQAKLEPQHQETQRLIKTIGPVLNELYKKLSSRLPGGPHGS